MKRSSIVLVLCATIALLCGCGKKQAKETVFYISTAGSDSWSGTLAEPNADKTDGPFATFEKAREAVRALKKTGAMPASSVTISIRGGKYTRSETFQLTAEDSGNDGAPVVWKSFQGESVELLGGAVVTGFEPVSDPAVLARIGKEYQGNILKADLKAQGITNLGEADTRNGKKSELFFKNKFMTISRYPNEGWLLIKDVPQTGEKMYYEGAEPPHIRDGIPPGRNFGRFIYSEDRPKKWADSDDIWMHGYWTWDWSDSYQRIGKIDKKTRTIWPSEPHHIYGYHKNQRYYFLNILEELDSPGEWYLDRANGILYFWPPEPIQEGDVIFPTFETVMVSLEETSNVKIQGITFACSRAGAVSIKGGTGNTIAGCRMVNLCALAVNIDGGTNNGITGCDIYDIAANAINISGGDRKTLTPGNNYADNNHIYNFCTVAGIGSAINIGECGNRATHNHIHDAPHHAINFGGNEHLIEFNEIHDVLKETDDAGAIYSGRDWTYRGNMLRHNYIHHIKGPKSWALGIYFDDNFSSATVYGNVFYKAGIAVHIGGGRDNIVENNIFVECAPSVDVGQRIRDRVARDGLFHMYEKLDYVKYNQPPYSTKYPPLATILDDPDPGFPRGNSVVRNVSYGGRWMNLHGLNFDDVEIKDNLIADPELVNWRKRIPDKDLSKTEKEHKLYKYGDREVMDELLKYGNVLMETDPGFVDLAGGEFPAQG